MYRNAFRCPAASVTVAVVGGATLLAVAYYFWSRPKKSCKPLEFSSANQSVLLESSEESGGDGRASAGMDTQENMISFDNEAVGGMWKGKEWFMEQMRLGESDETTAEQMARATETESVLRGLRDAFEKIGRVQEYLTTDMYHHKVVKQEPVEKHDDVSEAAPTQVSKEPAEKPIPEDQDPSLEVLQRVGDDEHEAQTINSIRMMIFDGRTEVSEEHF
ncbi:unnamed protein product [Caenorhabditis brenneri]